MKRTIFLSAIALALGAGSLSAGTIAVTVSGNSDLVNAAQYTTGWAFTTTQTFNVVALDYYDNAQNGLLNTHDVGIYTSTGTLLVSATVPSGTVGTLSGLYRSVAIPTFVLSPGSYVIGGYSNASSDPIQFLATSATPISGITIGNRNDYAFASGLTFPLAQAAGLQFFNPNFEVAAAAGVPEPATAGLALAAFAAFALRKRFRA